MSDKFEISKASNGQFHFHLKAANGEIILSSEMYEIKQSAHNGVASVQANCALDERYERKTNSAGKPYFNLKAANHQVIGNSEAYSTEEAREKGIAAVKKAGCTEVIVDLTV